MPHQPHKRITPLLLLSAAIGIAAALPASDLSLLWEIKEQVRGPETIVHDPKRDCLYVSNYDVSTPNDEFGSDSVGKLSLEGEVIEADWLPGLSSPLGMEIHEDRLYVVERWGINVIDLASARSIEKIKAPNAVFLNDITIAQDGTQFASDPGASTIYRIERGNVEAWASGTEFEGVNGLMDNGDSLLFGTSGDSTLKAIDKKTREVRALARFEGGIVDGIQKSPSGYFVSLYHGELFHVQEDAAPIQLLDTRERKVNCANFLYLEDRSTFYIPELRNNSISAYQLKE